MARLVKTLSVIAIGVFDFIVIVVKLLQPWKAYSPMEVIFEGNDTEVRFVQWANSHLLISLTPSSNTTVVRFWQLANVVTPISLTEDGIVTEVSPLPLNASTSILVTLEGMFIDAISLFLNAPQPIAVTVLGITVDELLATSVLVLERI